ncbi:MAG: hypothetical protein WCE63_23900 [Acidobacteriaceae bacterium]
MKLLLKLGPVFACLLIAAPAVAGDLVVTVKWTAQNPPWTSTVDSHADVNAKVLSAWQSISGNNGAMCQSIWNDLGPGISGAGNCIRNLYRTGNSCSFDQNPSISVDSGNNTAIIALRTSNNRLNFTTSVQGPCNAVNTGDPNFTADVDVNASAVLKFNGSQLSIASAKANITHISLSGNNLQAKAIIGMGNVMGAITPVLNRLVSQSFDFSGPLGPSVGQVNVALALAKSQLTLPGAVFSLGSDSNGVLLQAVYNKCLAGQTPGTFPGDNATACLNSPDWAKAKAVQSSCIAPATISLSCPAAAQRGPKPPDGWFGNGSCVSCQKQMGPAGYSGPGSCPSDYHYNAKTKRCDANHLIMSDQPPLR